MLDSDQKLLRLLRHLDKQHECVLLLFFSSFFEFALPPYHFFPFRVLLTCVSNPDASV